MEFITLLVVLVAFYYLFKKLSKLPNHSKKNNESELASFRIDAHSSSFDQQGNTRKQPDHQSKPTKIVRDGRDEDESELADFRIEISMGGFSQPKSRNKEPGRWIAPGETIKIDKFEINRGFFYVGGRLNSMDGYSTEASLVDPTLKINTNSPDYTGEYMDYWPSYDSITPKSRAAYLEWLASDRSDPETCIGYVFLYFYGIERRLLVDDRNGAVPYNEREALVLELKRLKDIYGHNRSFNNYATSFLSYLWILNPDCRAINELPSDDLLVAKRNFTSVFKFLLADTVQNGKPLNEELALAWVKSHPDYSLRTPARRCEDEFGILFKLRYRTRFGDGLKIKPNRTRLRLDYYTASASLRGDHRIELDLPDASLLKAPVKKLMDLAESCTKELEPLSRFIGRPGNSRDSIRALSLLPNDLAGLISDPRLDRIRTWMNSRESVRDRLISVKSLFDHLAGVYRVNFLTG